jgi:hypothetical protein
MSDTGVGFTCPDESIEDPGVEEIIPKDQEVLDSLNVLEELSIDLTSEDISILRLNSTLDIKHGDEQLYGNTLREAFTNGYTNGISKSIECLKEFLNETEDSYRTLRS